MILLPVPADVRQSIEWTHQQIARQYVTKRYDRMEALMRERFTPEFVWSKADGRRTNLIDLAAGGEADMKNARAGRGDGPIRWRTRLDNWSRTGDRITVDAHHDVVGEWLQGNRRLPVRFHNLVRETWALRGGEWKALSFREKWIEGAMDGRAIFAGKK